MVAIKSMRHPHFVSLRAWLPWRRGRPSAGPGLAHGRKGPVTGLRPGRPRHRHCFLRKSLSLSLSQALSLRLEPGVSPAHKACHRAAP